MAVRAVPHPRRRAGAQRRRGRMPASATAGRPRFVGGSATVGADGVRQGLMRNFLKGMVMLAQGHGTWQSWITRSAIR